MKLKVVKGYGCNNEQTLVVGSNELHELVNKIYDYDCDQSICKANATVAMENAIIDFIETKVGII